VFRELGVLRLRDKYASKEYADLLKEHGVRISMSRSGNPYDNAKCESFMKTLKYEEVYRQEYRDLGDARASSAAIRTITSCMPIRWARTITLLVSATAGPHTPAVRCWIARTSPTQFPWKASAT
jgi:transposase InsO family protein